VSDFVWFTELKPIRFLIAFTTSLHKVVTLKYPSQETGRLPFNPCILYTKIPLGACIDSKCSTRKVGPGSLIRRENEFRSYVVGRANHTRRGCKTHTHATPLTKGLQTQRARLSDECQIIRKVLRHANAIYHIRWRNKLFEYDIIYIFIYLYRYYYGCSTYILARHYKCATCKVDIIICIK